jgi:molecular chaperone GrpE
MTEETEPIPPAASPPTESPAPVDDWATRFKYLLADFENYRKRTERERGTIRRAAHAELIRTLLPLYETFGMALEAIARLPKDDPLRKGLELFAEEWKEFFESEHIEPVARPGDRFSAEDHEAVAEAPVTPDHREGTVVEVVQQGYRSAHGLLRPAKVVVARRHAETAEAGPAAAEPSLGVPESEDP